MIRVHVSIASPVSSPTIAGEFTARAICGCQHGGERRNERRKAPHVGETPRGRTGEGERNSAAQAANVQHH